MKACHDLLCTKYHKDLIGLYSNPYPYHFTRVYSGVFEQIWSTEVAISFERNITKSKSLGLYRLTRVIIAQSVERLSQAFFELNRPQLGLQREVPGVL